jgi:hypothetical protein
MYPYHVRFTVAPAWKLAPLTVMGVPGGAAGGTSVIVGDAAKALVGIIIKLLMDSVKMTVRKIAMLLPFCLCMRLSIIF